MASEARQRAKVICLVVFGALLALLVLWIPIAIARVLTGHAPWGPKVGGTLPNGIEVYFQARPAGFETDDRLIVVAPNAVPRHFWVDRVHGGFEYVVLRYNATGTQLWVESDGKIGASIDLATMDFRAESDTQHPWATYGKGTTLDAGNTSSILSLLRPW
jgi:hypothetical protein